MGGTGGRMLGVPGEQALGALALEAVVVSIQLSISQPSFFRTAEKRGSSSDPKDFYSLPR